MVRGIENNFQKWKCRILSVLGRVTVVKSEDLSRLQFLANATVIPKEYAKKVEKPICRFLWNGPIPKIAKIKAAKKWEDGGIKLPFVEDIIGAASMHWLKRIENSDAIWANTIKYELKHLGTIEAANNNTDLGHAHNNILSEHTKYILENWINLAKAKEQTVAHNLTTIWYNKWFTANTLEKRKFIKKTLSPENLLKYGIRHLEDFFDCDGRLLQADEAIARGLPKIARYEWDKVARSIKKSKLDTTLVRGKYKQFVLNENLPNKVTFRLGEVTLEGNQITQSKVLAVVAKHREAPKTTFVTKVNERFSLDDLQWKKVYRQIKNHSIATYKRSFIVKYLNKIARTNTEFVRVGHTETSKCTYCSEAKQDHYHLFWDCPEVNEFRQAVSRGWVLDSPLTLKCWCFGLFEEDTSVNKAIAFIAMELNNYIYSSNWAKEKLSIAKFKSTIYAMERVEYHIALEANKISKHLRKWEQIKNLI